MILVLIKLSHLFLIFNFGLNALPIISNTSDILNSTSNLEQKQGLSKSLVGKLPAIANLSLAIPKNFNLTQIAADLKRIGIDSLKDDTHLEGLPLDRNGRVNPDFHKEIFLGNHEMFEMDIVHDQEKRKKKLEEIFNDADLDRDGRLSKDELVNYVFKNVQQHVKEARDKNVQLFVLIDTNQDGKITWPEYSSLYVKLHKMNVTSIKDLNDIDFIQDSFDIDLQQELLKIRYRWTDTDNAGDNELDIDEFLAFRHPEIAGRSYKYVVDDIIAQMDTNDDQKLNETEFVFLPSSVLDGQGNKEWAEMDKRWLKEQKEEFHDMDEDKDGILTRDELLKAYDPLNRTHINNEVKKLFTKIGVSPANDSLSLDEVQKHADIFTDMRILDTIKKIHDEM